MKKSDELVQTRTFQLKREKEKLFHIETMLKSLAVLGQQLEAQVNLEEKKSRVSDKSSYKYPTVAKAYQERIEKLNSSINALDKQKEKAIKNIEFLNNELNALKVPAPAQPRPKTSAKASFR